MWMSLLSRWPDWLSGTFVTLELMAMSLLAGFILALLTTACRLSSFSILKKSAEFYVFVTRGTPLLVQIFVVYYGSGQFAWIKESLLWYFFNSPMHCAVLSLALNTAAYTSEIFKGAVLSIPKGQVESCFALGMSKLQTFWKVILPCALRQALPAYSNEVMIILKSTTLASTITIMDLMNVAHGIIADTYETIPCFVIAGIIYLILNSIIAGIFRLLETKWKVLV